ncbi:MAG: hypothetical protein WAN36_04270, partial [Calditrichia bacterium]
MNNRKRNIIPRDAFKFYFPYWGICILMMLTAFRTPSAADSWSIVQKATEPGLMNRKNIFFLNPDTGWVVGRLGDNTSNRI